MHEIYDKMRKTVRLTALFKKTSLIFASILVSYIVFFNIGVIKMYNNVNSVEKTAVKKKTAKKKTVKKKTKK